MIQDARLCGSGVRNRSVLNLPQVLKAVQWVGNGDFVEGFPVKGGLACGLLGEFYLLRNREIYYAWLPSTYSWLMVSWKID